MFSLDTAEASGNLDTVCLYSKQLPAKMQMPLSRSQVRPFEPCDITANLLLGKPGQVHEMAADPLLRASSRRFVYVDDTKRAVH